MKKKSLTPQEAFLELQNLLKDRQRQNSAYTLASFAQLLGLNPSTLQKIFNGSRKIGFRTASDAGRVLGFDVVREKQSKVSRLKKFAVNPIDTSDPEQLNWVHMAILEAIKLKDFRPDRSWLAKRLGLSQQTVAAVLKRMQAAGLIDCRTDTWIDLMSDSAVGVAAPLTNNALRTLQRDILRMSTLKIDDVPYSERDHSFAIVPVAKKDMQAFKDRIRRFRWEFCEMAQNSKGEKDEIYSLQISLFPLTVQGDTP